MSRARNAEIYRRYQDGAGFADLGRDYGITRQGVEQIVRAEERRRARLSEELRQLEEDRRAVAHPITRRVLDEEIQSRRIDRLNGLAP